MRNGKCIKCGSNKVGRLEKTWDEDGQYGYRPQTLGVRKVEKDWIGAERVHEGELETYVCASCGYVETYVKNPAAVPFEQLDGFSWIGTRVDDPYWR